jgi:hypothetical protein
MRRSFHGGEQMISEKKKIFHDLRASVMLLLLTVMYAAVALIGLGDREVPVTQPDMGEGNMRSCLAYAAFDTAYDLEALLLYKGLGVCGVTIYVPDESVEAYKTATNWNTYASRILPISEYAMVILPRENYTLTSEVQLSLQYYGEDVMPVWSVISDVATIDENGLLTFTSAGTAIVTASYNGESESKTYTYKEAEIITQADITDENLIRTSAGGGRNEFVVLVAEASNYTISVQVASGAPIKSCIHIKRSTGWADNEYDGGWINPGVTQVVTETKDADRSCPYAGVGFTYTSGAGFPTAEEVQQYCVIKIELVE